MTDFPDLPRVSQLLCPPQPRDLTKWHVSDLISKILGDGERGETDWGNNIMALGTIWEEVVMRRVVAEVTLDKGIVPLFDVKRELDGIIGTLDGLLCLPDSIGGGMMPWECKVRFRPRHHPREYNRWMYQVKAYCHMVGSNKAWFTGLFVSNRPPNADLAWWELEFSKEELEENWQMIVNMKEYLEREEA